MTEEVKKRKAPNKCDRCNKSFDELFSRQDMDYDLRLKWVCDKCFKKLHNKVSWDEYSEKHFYKEKK